MKQIKDMGKIPQYDSLIKEHQEFEKAVLNSNRDIFVVPASRALLMPMLKL